MKTSGSCPIPGTRDRVWVQRLCRMAEDFGGAMLILAMISLGLILSIAVVIILFPMVLLVWLVAVLSLARERWGIAACWQTPEDRK